MKKINNIVYQKEMIFPECTHGFDIENNKYKFKLKFFDFCIRDGFLEISKREKVDCGN
jgi:hypothetical protein